MQTLQIVHLCIGIVSCVLVWALVFQRLGELRERRKKITINHVEIDDPDKIALDRWSDLGGKP